MDAILTSIPWSGFGWAGLIFATVLGLIRGDIVTRREHATALASRDETIRREREIADRSMAALRLLAEEHGTTTDRILSALPVPKEEDHDATP